MIKSGKKQSLAFVKSALKSVSDGLKNSDPSFLVIISQDQSECVVFNGDSNTISIRSSFDTCFENHTVVERVSGVNVTFKGIMSSRRYFFKVNTKMFSVINNWITENKKYFVKDLEISF